jgi:hypothetical protein
MHIHPRRPIRGAGGFLTGNAHRLAAKGRAARGNRVPLHLRSQLARQGVCFRIDGPNGEAQAKPRTGSGRFHAH